MISITEILINNTKLTYAFKKDKNIYGRACSFACQLRKEVKLKKWENRKGKKMHANFKFSYVISYSNTLPLSLCKVSFMFGCLFFFPIGLFVLLKNFPPTHAFILSNMCFNM